MFTSLDTNSSCSFYHFYILFPFSELKATFHTQSIFVISRHSVSVHLSTAWPLSPNISQHSCCQYVSRVFLLPFCRSY